MPQDPELQNDLSEQHQPINYLQKDFYVKPEQTLRREDNGPFTNTFGKGADDTACIEVRNGSKKDRIKGTHTFDEYGNYYDITGFKPQQSQMSFFAECGLSEDPLSLSDESNEDPEAKTIVDVDLMYKKKRDGTYKESGTLVKIQNGSYIDGTFVECDERSGTVVLNGVGMMDLAKAAHKWGATENDWYLDVWEKHFPNKGLSSADVNYAQFVIDQIGVDEFFEPVPSNPL